MDRGNRQGKESMKFKGFTLAELNEIHCMFGQSCRDSNDLNERLTKDLETRISFLSKSYKAKLSREKVERNKRIVEDRDRGVKYTELARLYKVTPARVRQIYLEATKRRRLTSKKLPNFGS